MRAQIEYPKLPKGFIQWAWRRGLARDILDGKKDILQAIKQFERDVR